MIFCIDLIDFFQIFKINKRPGPGRNNIKEKINLVTPLHFGISVHVNNYFWSFFISEILPTFKTFTKDITIDENLKKEQFTKSSLKKKMKQKNGFNIWI